jgi:tripartite-type tricarboxylate transporter receptor subunit TctC
MLKKIILGRIAGALAISAFALSLGLTTANEAKAVDFKGKRIRVIIPFNEGGGTDSLARLMQPFYERHLPGKPKILVINKPGAGGIVGGNYFQSHAKKDGTWVMAISTSTVLNYVLGDPRVKFDIKKWEPIVLLPRGNMMYARKELGLKGLAPKAMVEKLRTFPQDALVHGGKTPTSSEINKILAYELLGVKLKLVWGMKGNGPMALAFERGEFTLMFDNSLSYKNNRKHFRTSGIANELFTFGAPDANGKWKDANGKWLRDPTWPKTPTFYEIYEEWSGKKFSDAGAQANATLGLIRVGVAANKAYLLPTGVDKGALKAWRDATRAIFKDPEFVAQQEKILGKFPVTIGKAAGTALVAAITLGNAEKKWIKDYFRKNFNLELNI